MNLSLDRREWKWNYQLLAFLIPFLGMLFIMLISGFQPFGDYSMLYSDMFHQYYPFFVAYRNALRSGESLLYNWNVGLGMDYLGLISYYLASPLNLLSVLVPEKCLLGYFSLLMPVKLGLASLFFSIFLKEIFGRNDFSVSVFGAFYGLCAWALGYQWNIMWLDTFALLPLVVLGMVRLLKSRRAGLYTLTLFLSIAANYYIGLFTCIFVFLLFFCYQICRWQGFKKFFLDLLTIAGFSALAIGMTAFLELPALQALQATQSSVNKFPTSFRLNMTTDHTIKGLLAVMKKVTGNLVGSLEPTFKEGLPNLYCGVGTLLLAVLYMMAKEVKLRDKLCALFLLTFFNLSFIIRQLDYIWHGFHFTNMIPYRFSFLYSFVLLYMAYRAWMLRNRLKPFQTVLAGIITAGLLSCSEELLETQTLKLGSFQPEVHVYIIYNGIFLVLYLTVLLCSQIHRRIPQDAEPEQIHAARVAVSRRRMVVRSVALGIVFIELAATLTNFGIQFNGTNVSNYPRGKSETASMVRYMKEREANLDHLFYRTETTHSQTLNDGALNGYYGVSAFTSSANVKVTEFMKALGYGAKNTYNRYCFEESSPAANLFLGLKYMLERQGRDRSSTWFTDVHHYGKVHLLENNAYLPLGFLAESSLADLEFTQEGSRFTFQDNLLAAASGRDVPVWHPVDGSKMEITAENVTLETIGDNGRCDYGDAAANAVIDYTIIPERQGFLCIRLDFPKRNHFGVRVNGNELYRENISLPQMLAVGDVNPGDVVEILIDVKSGEKSNVTVEAAILDPDAFWESYQVLAASQLEVTTFKSTFVEGYIDCNRDGLLYTSIPQNGNWHVLVDGRPEETVLVGDTMLAVPMTEGKHTVSFRYENRAFTIGLTVTALCSLIFGALFYVELRKTNRLPGKKRKR